MGNCNAQAQGPALQAEKEMLKNRNVQSFTTLASLSKVTEEKV